MTSSSAVAVAPSRQPPGEHFWELQRFGQTVHAGRQVYTEMWGYLSPGAGFSTTDTTPENDIGDANVRQSAGSQERGPATRPRQGRRASPAPPGPPSHPVEPGLTEALGLEDLFDYHRDAEWLKSSSGLALLAVPVALFRSLPYRAVLLVEVPTAWPAWMSRPDSRKLVPDVRAWAYWTDGIAIRSHHEYLADHCMCVCRPEDWTIGANPIEDYVAFCICWIAKALHCQAFGWWPGPQHYPDAVRYLRDVPPNEHCGCGEARLYTDCCKAEDESQTVFERWMQVRDVTSRCRVELRCRGLSTTPPYPWLSSTN